MSVAKKRQTLPVKITDKTVANIVSKALRQEYAELNAAIKWIVRITGIPANTVAKWYRGSNAPKSSHLLILIAYYPYLLHSICKTIGREDMWNAAVRFDIPQSMQTRLAAKHPTHAPRDDRFVTPWITNSQTGAQFNSRQLWFLEQLRRGSKLQAKDIIASWQVHERTARRDIAWLIEVGLIRFVPSGKTGWYALL